MAPIFVPMLMLLGFSPELTQVAYRTGDSTTNRWRTPSFEDSLHAIAEPRPRAQGRNVFAFLRDLLVPGRPTPSLLPST
jgi:hypothetical protein